MAKVSRITIATLSFFLWLSTFAYSTDRVLSIGEWESVRMSVRSWVEIKNSNLVRQEYDYSCGSASLATILKFFFNDNVGEQEVLDSVLKKKGIDKSDKGKLEEKDMKLSFYDLKEFAEERGYKSFGIALSLETLKKLKVPAIVFVTIRKKEHFSVYKGMDDRFIYLADPSFGNIKVSHSRFAEMFYSRDDQKLRGKMLVFVPSDQEEIKINEEFMKIPETSGAVYRKLINSIYID